MAKESGLGDQFYFGGYDLSGDTAQVGTIRGGMATLPATGINKSAMERFDGRRDGELAWTAYFNPTASQAHPVLAALPRTDVVGWYGHGSILGNPAAGIVTKQIGYDGSRDADGGFLFAASALGNGFGLEWGVQHTAGIRSDTTATNGTAVDSGAASTTFGLQAYLQVFSFTGTSATIKIQESSDNAGDAYADVVGGSFGAISAARQGIRIATSAVLTVERYLRVVTTGTFSQCSFAVLINRNATATVF